MSYDKTASSLQLLTIDLSGNWCSLKSLCLSAIPRKQHASTNSQRLESTKNFRAHAVVSRNPDNATPSLHQTSIPRNNHRLLTMSFSLAQAPKVINSKPTHPRSLIMRFSSTESVVRSRQTTSREHWRCDDPASSSNAISPCFRSFPIVLLSKNTKRLLNSPTPLRKPLNRAPPTQSHISSHPRTPPLLLEKPNLISSVPGTFAVRPFDKSAPVTSAPLSVVPLSPRNTAFMESQKSLSHSSVMVYAAPPRGCLLLELEALLVDLL